MTSYLFLINIILLKRSKTISLGYLNTHLILRFTNKFHPFHLLFSNRLIFFSKMNKSHTILEARILKMRKRSFKFVNLVVKCSK